MAKLDITLSKDAFEALDESLKDFYTPNKEGGYELDGIGSLSRAVEAEKKQAAEKIEKAKQAAVAEALKQFEGLDIDEAKQALADRAKAAEDKLKGENNWDGLKKQLEERHATELEKLAAQVNAIKSEQEADRQLLKREQLKNVLVQKGVLADRVDYGVIDLEPQVELVRGERSFDIRKIGGIGDATEFELMIEGLKKERPFLFQADNATGGGATGSNGGGRSGVKTATKAEVAKMSPSQKREFFLNDGEVSDYS